MINALLKNKRGQSQVWDYTDLLYTVIILTFIFFFVGFLVDSEKLVIQERIKFVSNTIKQTDSLLVNFKLEGSSLSRDVMLRNDGSNPYLLAESGFPNFATGVPGESTSTVTEYSSCDLECQLEELLLELNPEYKTLGNHFIIEYSEDDHIIVGKTDQCKQVCNIDEIYLPSFEEGVVRVTYVACGKSQSGTITRGVGAYRVMRSGCK